MTHRIIPRHYSPLRPANVIVADYDTDEASTLAEGLRDDGCSVTIASSGVELLDLLCKPRTLLQHVDCVVATTMLPGTDALEVLRMFDGSAAATPFVLITETAEEQAAAAQLRAVTVYPRPITLAQVRSQVLRLLARDSHG